MRKSIHEIIVGSYDVCKELNVLNELFFDEEIIPLMEYGTTVSTSMYDIVNEYFYKWPYGGTCFDFGGYIDVLNEDESCCLNRQLNCNFIKSDNLLTLAFGNAEFYYNMHKFITSLIFDESCIYVSNSEKDLALVARFGRNLNTLIDYINVKPVEIEPLKYVLLPNNEAAISVAEITGKGITRKSILMYNHFSVKGDIEAKRIILNTLAHDFDKGKQRDKKTPEDSFCYIVNAANIRHNNTLKDGKSIIDDMTDDEIEDVYDTAYRLYLTAKLDEEYQSNLRDKVDAYKFKKRSE